LTLQGFFLLLPLVEVPSENWTSFSSSSFFFSDPPRVFPLQNKRSLMGGCGLSPKKNPSFIPLAGSLSFFADAKKSPFPFLADLPFFLSHRVLTPLFPVTRAGERSFLLWSDTFFFSF